MAGYVARTGRGEGAYRVGGKKKPERKKPIRRTRRRWEDNIKMHLQEVGCRGMDWIELARDRDKRRALVTAVRNFRFP